MQITFEDNLRAINEWGFLTQQICEKHGGVYTIGFELTLNHPELIMLGLPPEYCHRYLWTAFHAIHKAAFIFQPGQKLHRFLMVDFPFAVVEVDRAAFLKTMRQSVQFYRWLNRQETPRALQLIFCDKQGRFPWNEGSDLAHHPLLGKFPGFSQDIDMHEILMSTKPAE